MSRVAVRSLSLSTCLMFDVSISHMMTYLPMLGSARGAEEDVPPAHVPAAIADSLYVGGKAPEHRQIIKALYLSWASW
jgi:hypothetical protein